MAEINYDKNINMDILKGKKIAIIGYGSQGHAHAQNLRESGMDVIVGELEGGKPWEAAKSKGFEVYSADKAAKMDYNSTSPRPTTKNNLLRCN